MYTSYMFFYSRNSPRVGLYLTFFLNKLRSLVTVTSWSVKGRASWVHATWSSLNVLLTWHEFHLDLGSSKLFTAVLAGGHQPYMVMSTAQKTNEQKNHKGIRKEYTDIITVSFSDVLSQAHVSHVSIMEVIWSPDTHQSALVQLCLCKVPRKSS